MGSGRSNAATLVLRRLMLADPAEAGRTRSAKGIHKSRPSRRASRLTASVGTIFGSTLTSVLEFAGVSEHLTASVRVALRDVARFLDPVKRAVVATGGDDRVHLASGLVMHHVCTAQRRCMPELAEAQDGRTYMGRRRLKHVAVGATAAVLVAYHLRFVGCASAAAAVELRADLDACCATVDELLRTWPVPGVSAVGTTHMALDALHAERRAMQRARAAAVAAARAASAQHLDATRGLELQLDWMRAAAWPAGIQCDVNAHAAACGHLVAHGVLTRDNCDARLAASPMPCPLAVVPLSALPSDVWVNGERGDSGDGDGAWSSCSSSVGTATTGSSMASSSSVGDDDAYRHDDGHMTMAATVADADTRAMDRAAATGEDADMCELLHRLCEHVPIS